MATPPVQSALPLSNADQAFKSISDHYPLKINDVVIIMRKEDGYVNLTKLCQAGGKELNHWNSRKKRDLFLDEVSSTTGIPVVELIRQDKGDIHNRQTWGHRRVAINIAQWISPKFDNAVTGWIEELLLTGSVTLGQEKTQQELEQAQRKIFELTENNRNLEIYNVSLQRKHRALLQKRKHFTFNEGHCFYLIQDPRISDDRCKFGITSDINLRLKQHRTSWPNLHIRYLVFIDGENECKIIEGSIRRYYEQKRKLETSNHEHIKGVSIDNVIARVEFLLNATCIQYKVDETIDKYNEENKEEVESDDDENTIITTKSGLVHKIESHDEPNTDENDDCDDLDDAETTVVDKTDVANIEDLDCFQIDDEIKNESEDDECMPEVGTSAMLEAIIKKEKYPQKEQVETEKNTLTSRTISIMEQEILNREKEDVKIAYNTRKVNQYELNGKYIRTYERLIDAERQNNCKKLSVFNCCKRIQRQAYGYQWRYSDEVDGIKDIEPMEHKLPRFKRRVLKYTIDNVLVEEFDSVKEASVSAGVTGSSMSDIIRQGRIRCGYRWKYEETEQTQTPTNNEVNEASSQQGDVIEDKEQKQPHSNAKPVIKMTKERVEIQRYVSAEEAAKSIGVTSSQVIGCCKGRRKTTGGFAFKYAEE